MVSLPLKHMVLYKHGIGFFVRGGEIGGEELSLTFREDEVNDVLKSLTIFDRAGGKVLGIDYRTPMDKEARLASSSIRLSQQATLRDLLRDLRGRQVALTVESAADAQETVSGRVVGIDIFLETRIANDASDNRAVVGIASEDGQVRFFPLDALRGLTIHDPQSAQDLSYFLDTNMQEDNRRSVHVRLTEGDHDLVVQYVAPSPTWRVSYRMVAESEKDGKSGRALVQGWGLFDNRLEENLDNVSVTLVAGQPISFIYELYASRIPQRPLVEDESRVAPGPIRVDGAVAAMSRIAGGGRMRGKGLAGKEEPERGMAFAAAPVRAGSEEILGVWDEVPTTFNELAASTVATAETAESGEFFEYRVTTPVSVRRGESAMVPILSEEVTYQRELVYNGQKLPNHPVAALRFMNSTGLTLESGPVTVSEDGDYRGEAVVPFTKDGGEVYLPFAVELGVRITEKPSGTYVNTGIAFKKDLMIHEQYHVIGVEYVIENTTPNDLIVVIEARISNAKYEPFDTPDPDSETAHDRRWRVNVSARARTSFVRQERMRTQRSEVLRGLRLENLREYLENKWLDQKTFDTLSGIQDILKSIEQMRSELVQITAQRKQLFDQQAQLRENLTSLQGSGDEGSLRSRMVSRLEKTQDQLDALDIQEKTVDTQILDAEDQIDQIIASLPQSEET